MFVSFPLRGHANQMIALAEELVCRGYQVSFVISEDAKEWIVNTGANFINWEIKNAKNNPNIDDDKNSFWQKVSPEKNLWRGELMMLHRLINRYVSLYQTLIPIFQQYNPDLLTGFRGWFKAK